MKILYLFCDGTLSEGVISKVKAKINGLNRSGIDTKGLFITPNIKKEEYNSGEKIRYVPFVYKDLPGIYNRRYIRNYRWYFNYNNYIRQLYSVIGKELKKENFDYILFRYPLSNKYLAKLSSQYKGKIIFEHNTMEPEEIASGGLKDPVTNLVYKYEKEYAPAVLGNSKGIIGVTNEIREYELKRSNNKKIKAVTISNGVDINKFPLRKKPVYDGKTLNLLMLCGSAVSWHGEDLVIKAISEYKGPVAINFYVLGNVLESSKKLAVDLKVTDKVKFTESLKGADLDEIFNRMHAGIGTLALKRKGLKEAVPLKVREYMGRGIPFVIGYTDPDLEGQNSLKDLHYKIENPAEEISIQKIIDFVSKVYKMENHEVLLRSEALRLIDTEVKTKALSDFILQLN